MNAVKSDRPERARAFPGHFISFEGPEGSGKTTHAASLTARLEAAGLKVQRVREPGGTALGEAVRSVLQHTEFSQPVSPRAEVMLFEACRAQIVDEVIRPALQAGRWVLCDRFADSTTAYQGAGRGLDATQLDWLNRYAAGRDCWPELTLLLDVDVEEGFARIGRRGGGGPDRFEQAGREFHNRVRKAYLDLARQDPGRFVVIQASQPLPAVEEQIRRIVAERFGLALG